MLGTAIATSPYYTIDFGDGTPITLPELLTGLTKTITYTYDTSGVFNVVVSVFNKVSYSTQNFTVSVFLNIYIGGKSKKSLKFLNLKEFY